ncbi:HTH-type transcriptional regulator SyrM 1 [Paraburkholderia caffeinitolerans]|uniref:HTH-type transcriptional regulator SyrM 1 n=1 Tax=Paraburkholderia caffeinitolerans TaxID=1723730 RepID=A0A6J5H2G1_9BURK|nr:MULTISPECIES: LysR family transcriptional regulator [Paraburkholderia]CAB3809346.1 HTH-type transcriptional regulator SyrM 1 [Paraburkholderia caffeinitolerans]
MQNVDLKSLQLFATLLRECNVTRTARQLNMTQSAVSHTLNRLRDLFRDPLFVTAGRSLAPTPRALELAEPLHRALAVVGALIEPDDGFVPATLEGTFEIATTDYIGFLLLPVLMDRLSVAAPGVAINVKPLEPDDDLAALREGALDLILWNEDSAPSNYYVRKLFTDRLKSIVRAGHPHIQGGLSAEQFRAARHIRVSGHYGAVKEAVDAFYEHLGIRVSTAVTVPHFMLAHMLVSQSDMIGMIAELTARRIAGNLPLQVLEPPVEMAPFTVSAVWHARRHTSGAHRWLRGEIVAAAEQLTQQSAAAA